LVRFYQEFWWVQARITRTGAWAIFKSSAVESSNRKRGANIRCPFMLQNKKIHSSFPTFSWQKHLARQKFEIVRAVFWTVKFTGSFLTRKFHLSWPYITHPFKSSCHVHTSQCSEELQPSVVLIAAMRSANFSNPLIKWTTRAASEFHTIFFHQTPPRSI
jgi:hypothetical protein